MNFSNSFRHLAKGYLAFMLSVSEWLEAWTVTQMVGGSIPEQEAKHLARLITRISDIYIYILGQIGLFCHVRHPV